MERFALLHPVLQALVAGLFTWVLTAAGAAIVFLARRVQRRLLDAALGFSGGVMLAASYWSLLAPAIEIAEEAGGVTWLPAAGGFLAGAGVLRLLDRLLPHLHLFGTRDEAEGPPTAWRRSVLLVLAITLHNLPEGLAVGAAFGGAALAVPATTLAAAIVLSVGIALQNVPEGTAVAMPLRAEGMGRLRAFWYGQLSAAVEPLAAVAGAAAVVAIAPLLPFALSFAAGAMVYVVVEELIPEAERAGNVDLATSSLACGFVLMMVLDLALG